MNRYRFLHFLRIMDREPSLVSVEYHLAITT